MIPRIKIGIVGTGYVGIVTGCCLASLGFSVWCMDAESAKVDMLNNGQLPIYEPELEDIFIAERQSGRLRFVHTLPELLDVDVIFITVGTLEQDSQGGRTGALGCHNVSAIVTQLFSHGFTGICVIKSTVAIGFTENIYDSLGHSLRETHREQGEHNKNSKDFDRGFSILLNPEFLRQGQAIHDFMNPDRVVIGSIDGVENSDVRILRDTIYAPILQDKIACLITDFKSAEMIKIASNAFLAVKLSFINEISSLCEALGGDIRHVAHGIGLDARIGLQHFSPGPGYGGSCLPKDTESLVSSAERAGSPITIAAAARDANDKVKRNVIQKIQKCCGEQVAGKSIALCGIGFKSETDDVRNSIALFIMHHFCREGATFVIFDKVIQNCPELQDILQGISLKWAETLDEVMQAVDLLVLINACIDVDTEGICYHAPMMRQRIVLDLRNSLCRDTLKRAGIQYYGIGTAVDNRFS